MKLSPDYENYLEEKLTVITGAARSGTSIVGKIVGSLEDCYYSFEPLSFTLIVQLVENNYLPFDQGKELIKGILFEDIFLQAIHGRNINFNERDDSYIGNYMDIEEIKEKWKKFRRRRDVLDYLERNDILFVIKIPNLQPCMKTLKKMFPKIKFIHMVRNGNDVISSSMKRGFYTREYLNNRNVDCWSIKEGKKSIMIPWYVKDKNFPDWNHQTRCAHIWRVLNEEYLDYKKENSDSVLNVKLEKMIENPEFILNSIENKMEKKRTDITINHLKSIRNFTSPDYPDNTKYIINQEVDKYKETSRKLGY
ncbi:MAG: sulfotransferase [Candidatus Thermoplasmatota archaeon]